MGTKPQGRTVQPVVVVGSTPGGGPVPVKASPGGTVLDDADVTVPSGGHIDVPLTPPANPRRLTVQVQGPIGAAVLSRFTGDSTNTGLLLLYTGVKEYGGVDGAIPTSLTFQDVSSPAVGATVALVWEAD